MTMNAQCWSFLELPVRRAASRMRSRCSGAMGSSLNSRTTRTVSMACQVSMQSFHLRVRQSSSHRPKIEVSLGQDARTVRSASVQADVANADEAMDTDLVVRAQRGDKEAFADLAFAIADRFLAVSRRILRDIDLAEDATQQALLSIWQDLPQLRDPARFEAWSYRILLRACYAEGRKQRRWAPNLRLLPADEPTRGDGMSSVADRDQLEGGFRRLPSTTDRWWSCTTSSTCPSTVLP